MHVAVDGLLALAALAAAVAPVGSLVRVVPDLPGAGLPHLAFVALGAWLVVTCLTILPEVLAAAKPQPGATAAP